MRAVSKGMEPDTWPNRQGEEEASQESLYPQSMRPDPRLMTLASFLDCTPLEGSCRVSGSRELVDTRGLRRRKRRGCPNEKAERAASEGVVSTHAEKKTSLLSPSCDVGIVVSTPPDVIGTRSSLPQATAAGESLGMQQLNASSSELESAIQDVNDAALTEGWIVL